jgi:hypothetical protein
MMCYWNHGRNPPSPSPFNLHLLDKFAPKLSSGSLFPGSYPWVPVVSTPDHACHAAPDGGAAVPRRVVRPRQGVRGRLGEGGPGPAGGRGGAGPHRGRRRPSLAWLALEVPCSDQHRYYITTTHILMSLSNAQQRVEV